jgi:alkylresorcinol/alkylpyrone synthase
MAHVIGLGLAVPPYVMPQAVAKALALEHFSGALSHVERLAQVFEHAEIDTRYVVVPPEWWRSGDHSFKARNEFWVSAALELATQAITRALDAAGIPPTAIDNLLVVTSTGIASPSLDAYLINCLGLRRDVRRTPIWGLGCAAGVAGLARAAELARAYPRSITLLVAVEISSLTFQFGDRSKKNFIAVSLFGDGAAAALIAGDQREETGIELLDAMSTTWPDSLDVMGWHLVDSGLDVVFGAHIPRYVVERFRPEVETFLSRHRLTFTNIAEWVLHPGGAKVIQAYAKALGLDATLLDATRAVMRQYGNMSSPTALFVLDYVQRQHCPPRGAIGLMAALGPGFSAEQVLIRF